MKYFLAVCREGTMSKAAASLHLTQPTLSRQIADLERELGCKLLERGGRRIELTPEGLYLRRRANELVCLADQTVQDLCASEAMIEGTVRIAAGESWRLKSVARVMADFHETHPGVSFALHSGNTEDVSWRLDQGLADFAIFMSYVDEGLYDHVRFAMSDRWGLLVPKDHPLARQDGIHPEDLEGIALIVSENTIEQGILVPWLGELRGALEIVSTYSLAFNAALMVEEGLGCALALEGLVPTGKETALAFVPLVPIAVSTIDLAWKRNEPLAPAPAAFLEALRASELIES